MRLALLPSRITAVDAAGEEHDFTVRPRWDGRVAVRRGYRRSPWPGRGRIVTVAPDQCLRRRLRLRPTSQADLRAIAADLYPFDLTDYRLALFQRADGIDVCALAEDDFRDVAPDALVIAVAEPTPAGLLAAVQDRLAHGESFDFLPGPPRLVSPASVFAVGHVMVLAATVAVVASVLMLEQSAEERKLRAELLGLQEDAAALTQRRLATAAMVHSVNALARFSARPAVAAELAGILEPMPLGTLVDRVTWKDGQLVLTGLGNEAREWLGRAGVTDAEMSINDLPKMDRFTVTRSLKTP